MRAGDVIFIRGTSWLSGLIRKVDPGEFSHVAIATSDTDIFEAQYYMRANIVTMHYTDYTVVSLNLTDEEVQRLRVMCTVLSGQWYDYKQAFGYLMRMLFGSNVQHYNNPNHLICSEALSLFLYMLNKIDEPLGEITPNELFTLLGGVL